MRTKTVNKILGMICIMLCFWSLSIPCFAAGPDASGPMHLESLSTMRCSVDKKDGKIIGQAILSGKRGVEKSKISLTIQRKDGSKWVSVGTWAESTAGRNLSMSKSVTAKAGSTYRTKATVTVWLNGKAETKTLLSNETIA